MPLLRYPGYTWSAPQYTSYRTPLYSNAPWTHPLPPWDLHGHALGGPPIGYIYPGYQPAPPNPMGLVHHEYPLFPEPVVELHKLLGGWHWPIVIWDVAQEPSTARRITPHRTTVPISPRLLEETATRPFGKFMRIMFDPFPWDISIDIPHSAPDVVRVRNVFECIHQLLHEPLDADEWQRFDSGTQANIYGAMLERLNKAPPSLKPDGILKIDCLLGKTKFMGLKPARPGGEEWLVRLRFPRP